MNRPLKITAFILALFVAVAVATLAPVDRMPVAAQQFYQSTMQRVHTSQAIEATGELQAGWSRVSITPGYPMPMAGYAPRESFHVVHDSLYARMLTLRTGELTVSFVSVDLLLFPPALRDRLDEKADSADLDQQLYLSATHTHNGIGGWDDSFIGRWSLGKFDNNWVETTANALLIALQGVSIKPSQIRYWESKADELVENRVDRDNGQVDGVIRGVELVRSDSTNAVLYTFSAHPTSIDQNSRELSGDYPGALTNRLENEFNFAMFMAGMVGSHRLAWVPHTNYDLVEFAAQNLVEKIKARELDSISTATRVRFLSQPIEFGPSQLRIGDNWKVRDWLFRSLLRPLEGNVVMVEIGHIVFVGLPCDFSGEIFKVERLGELARLNEKHLIVTSFNGDYDGYITLDRHYDQSDAEEIRTLNWVGPGYGEYFTAIIKALVERKE